LGDSHFSHRNLPVLYRRRTSCIVGGYVDSSQPSCIVRTASSEMHRQSGLVRATSSEGPRRRGQPKPTVLQRHCSRCRRPRPISIYSGSTIQGLGSTEKLLGSFCTAQRDPGSGGSSDSIQEYSALGSVHVIVPHNRKQSRDCIATIAISDCVAPTQTQYRF
jgi:hypothetical protein